MAIKSAWSTLYLQPDHTLQECLGMLPARLRFWAQESESSFMAMRIIGDYTDEQVETISALVQKTFAKLNGGLLSILDLSALRLLIGPAAEMIEEEIKDLYSNENSAYGIEEGAKDLYIAPDGNPYDLDGVGAWYYSGDSETDMEAIIGLPVPLDNPDGFERPFDFIFHEIGHHIDAVLNDISQSSDYMAAYEADYKNLQRDFGDNFESEGAELIHNWQGYFLHKPLGDQACLRDGCKESFAELFAYAADSDYRNNEPAVPLNLLMPRCFSLIKMILQRVERHCSVISMQSLSASGMTLSA